jgi:3-oxoacyl-[acyl-carrier protein] reductase
VVLGSTSTYIATPGQPGYGASKGALLTLVKSFAHAWAHESVRVNGIAPGFVETKLTHRTSSDPKRFEASLDRISLRRWGRAEEMGDAGLFLASPTTSYITGQMLRVDGGITLMS